MGGKFEQFDGGTIGSDGVLRAPQPEGQSTQGTGQQSYTSAFDDPSQRNKLTLWDFLQQGAPNLNAQMQNPFAALQGQMGTLFGGMQSTPMQQTTEDMASSGQRLTRAMQKQQGRDKRRDALMAFLKGS